MTSAVSLAGIGLVRTGDRGEPIFAPVDIEIAGGDRVALTGPSGAGKTLVLRLLALLDSPDAGEIRWADRPIDDDEAPLHRRRVHLLAQGAPMVRGTARRNLEIADSVATAGGARPDTGQAEALLSELGASGILEREVLELSGGERQLIALTRALLIDPKVMLLDEPTSALDPERVAAAERLIGRWLAGGDRAAVWVSHDAAQRHRVTDRAVEVRRG